MAKATKNKHPTDGILQELRAFGMAYPGAHFKSPWPGHMDLAVNDKTFAYLSLEGEPLGISCKLPRSSEMALMLPFCKPTGYGLGKSGWVSASFDDADVDVAMLKAWIDESYRAQAPKRLVASLGAPVTGDAAPAGEAKPAKRAATARTTAAKPAKRAAPASAAKKPAKRAAAAKPAKRAAAKGR
jgi:predicted DNA-binding protein (MmcQ/YjbR family)